MEDNKLKQSPDTMAVSEIAEDTHRRALVIGIGGCGLRILQDLNNTPGAEQIDTLAIDTDAGALDACSAKWKINAFADYNVSNLPGCGGDTERGARAVAHERSVIMDKWAGHDIVIVVGHLGGGTATGGMQTLVSISKSQKIPTMFLLLTPFSFEGYPRNNKAEICLEEMLPQTDVLIPIPSDLLFSTCLTADVHAGEAFARATHEIAVMISGLAAMLQGYDLIGTNFADIATALRKKKNICGLGVGSSSAEDPVIRSSEALKNLITSPFLGGQDHIDRSNVIVITLSGGSDMTVGDMKRTLELVSERFPKKCELIYGVNIVPGMEGALKLTALAIYYDIMAQPKRRKKREGNSAAPGQPADPDEIPGLFGMKDDDIGLNLSSYTRGIFEKKPEILYQGVDLDIPTYQRKNIHIVKEN